MRKNNRKGFTIVELVIVIAVIAILATVLVPTFGNVIEKANKSKDLQAAKSAYTLYVADIDYAGGETAENTVYYKGTHCVIKIENGSATIAEDVTAIPNTAVEIDEDGKVVSAETSEEDED